MMFAALPRRRVIGPVVLACGAAGLLTLAACSSASPAGPAAAAAASASAPGTAAAAAPGTPAAGSPATGAQPSWAAALGPAVTVVPPRQTAPGHGSPGAAVTGFISAVNSGHYAKACAYAAPASQAGCRSQAGQTPARDIPSVKGFALGYIAIDGGRAAAGMTGTYCDPAVSATCSANANPAAVFSTAKSFSALWGNANTPSATRYTLTPCVKVDGKWYFGS